MRRTARVRPPQLRLRWSASLALAAIGALTVSLITAVNPVPAAAAAPTAVTIGFDDGTVDQLGALPILQAHGMTATFFVNTGFLGDAEHLTWDDLRTLSAAGNEIAGHTLHHANLAPLTTAEARQEVCTDRNNLLDNGFQPTSFAYPFGSFDSGTEQVVQACGYNSGRGVSGIDKTGPFAETIPPLDPYATRTPPNPKKSTKLATLEQYVLAAEANGGGWVQFVFHRLCEQCGPYAISPAKFTAFLDFVQTEVTGGRVTVQTTAQVIGGEVRPPIPA
jgi:peptidoglycan/xylan/chitin deacetylase (PgdA/CDA1 family)